MYIVIIDEGCYSRKEQVQVFSSIVEARASVWWYIRKVDKTRGGHDVVDAKLYKVTRKRGPCALVDEFSDVALDDGYAEGWKSEGRREAEHRQWEAKRETERQWREKYVAIPIERHAD